MARRIERAQRAEVTIPGGRDGRAKGALDMPVSAYRAHRKRKTSGDSYNRTGETAQIQGHRIVTAAF